MLLNPLSFHTPHTLPEAAKLYKDLGDVKILAGGTFLLNSLKTLKKKGNKTPQNVISLRKIGELKGIEIQDDTLVIKSMTVITDLLNSPHLKDNFSVLRTVCRNISTTPIRNMATVGGNLTSRYTWTELGAVLIALEAKMHFRGNDGKEEILSVDEFFNNNARTNKILEAISLKRNREWTIAYQRVRKMSCVDQPLLAICIRTTFKQNRFTDTRATINSGTAFAKRDLILEKFLNESSLNDVNLAKEALNHLDAPIYDTRSDDYKKTMFRVSIKNAMIDLIERGKNAYQSNN